MADRPDLMTQAEFAERAEILFGKNWRKPLGRQIERSPRMIRNYAAGARIPPDIADKLRRLTEIGETGFVIRDAIQRAVPKLAPSVAHAAAREVLAALTAAGALAEAPAPKPPVRNRFPRFGRS
jgi:hypothetical protein